MSSPFVAEIRIVAFNFAPRGWATCDGQLLSIAQNTALFSLLGTTYGGDGRTTFGLPDFQGRAPLSSGQGPGLSQRFQGEISGTPTVTLTNPELPIHAHTAMGLPTIPDPTPVLTPAGNVWAVAGTRRTPVNIYTTTPGTSPLMNPQALSLGGGGQPHNNWHPYQCQLFIIALQGVFPPRA